MPKFKLFANRKGKADQEKNNRFVKLAREIYVQVRKGGPNPEGNYELRTAIANARAIQMPTENIERAIKKAVGAGVGEDYEEIVYEGYGPGAVAIMVRCLTDNRNRTASDIRALFNKRGGNLGETGCVSYLFRHKGVIIISRKELEIQENDFMMEALEAGAEDVIVNEEEFAVITSVKDFSTIKNKLDISYSLEEANLSWLPQIKVTFNGKDAENLLKLLDAFEENDDVQDVYHNFEISEEQMNQVQR